MFSPSSFILFLCLQIPSSFSSPPHSTHDVIIIGAGPSGIAAFSVLAKNKTDVIILEAENRIGGRINTVEFGENVVDLGAQWVHGNENIAFKLGNDFEMITRSNFTSTFCYSNRKELPQNLIDKLQEISMEVLKCQEIQEGLTVAEFITERFINLTSNLITPDEFPNLLEDMLENLKHEYLAGISALDWYEPSARSDNEDCDDKNYNWKGNGYKTVLNILLNKPPFGSDDLETEQKILLNKKVIKIDYESDDVKIYCNDSTEYRAKRVIFTPSLGVLKAKMNEMFHPNLPDQKRKAIETLGIGGVAKVYLEYSNDWFNNKHGKFDVLDLIWEKNLRESLRNFTTDEGQPWITDLSAILSVDYNPKLLYLWFEGQSIPFIENLTEDKLMEGLQFALNQFFGYETPKPVKILRSKWYTNENFLGTYSYQTIESRKQPSNKHLGEPLNDQNGKNVVYFAGEATSLDHYSTVHGAIQSGFREAENVLKSMLSD